MGKRASSEKKSTKHASKTPLAPVPGETPDELRRRVDRLSKALHKAYPAPETALDHKNAFELLIATILSAQCTDAKVNEVTPELFKHYPNAKKLAAAETGKVEELVRQTGFYRQKTKSIQKCAQMLADDFGGEVPEAMEDLVKLPGVGRKTANVIRGNAMGLPGFAVDTHVKRLVGRLGLTAATDPDKIEAAMNALLPEKEWTHFSNALIWHGRRVCPARAPRCPECPLLKDCPTGQSVMAE